MAMDVSKFVQLKPEEEVLEVVREDFFPHLPKILLFAVWFIVPWFFLFPLLRAGVFGVVAFLLLVLTSAVFGYREYLKWSHTVFVITDRRIIDIEQNGLFDRVFSEVSFPQVDEVSYKIKGFFPTLLRYGVLVIKTTGNAADLEFVRLRGPARLHDLINDLRESVKDEARDRKKRRISKLAKHLSMDEIKELAREVRRKEQREAMNELYQAEDES